MKKVALVLMLCALATGSALAQNPPPAYGGYLAGWGMNPTTWSSQTGTFSSWGIYNPGAPHLAGLGWVTGYNVDGTPIYIVPAPVTLELWIELYCFQYYEFTSYKWHRRGDEAGPVTITFKVRGLVNSNHPEWIGLTKGADDLGVLTFRNRVIGLPDPANETNIPITWHGYWGPGNVYYVGTNDMGVITPSPDVGFRIPKSNNWFEFEGSFELLYHQADGYYSMTMAGCPAPEL